MDFFKNRTRHDSFCREFPLYTTGRWRRSRKPRIPYDRHSAKFRSLDFVSSLTTTQLTPWHGIRGQNKVGDCTMKKSYAVLAVAISLPWAMSGARYASAQQIRGASEIRELKHGASLALRDIPPARIKTTPSRQTQPRPRPASGQSSASQPDPVLQRPAIVRPLIGATSVNFPGIGYGSPNFTSQYFPPDANGAVGPKH